MDASADAAQAADNAEAGMMPAATAGGDYAVSFGRYASQADAQKVVAALTASQLPGYQEAVEDKDRTLYRVRIGPYASQADAESARLRAAHVRDDVGAKVVVLSADETAPAAAAPAATPPASTATAAATPAPAKAEPLPPAKAPAKPAETTTKPATTAAVQPPPATTKPATAPTPTRPAAATPPAPAAANTGFAVQLGAFGNADEANRLRDRARAAGLRAFVESVRTDKGVLSRVRVGPVLTRAEADQLKTQVVAKLGIADAIVKPHP
jgi:cell division septation protein DedD